MERKQPYWFRNRKSWIRCKRSCRERQQSAVNAPRWILSCSMVSLTEVIGNGPLKSKKKNRCLNWRTQEFCRSGISLKDFYIFQWVLSNKVFTAIYYRLKLADWTVIHHLYIDSFYIIVNIFNYFRILIHSTEQKALHMLFLLISQHEIDSKITSFIWLTSRHLSLFFRFIPLDCPQFFLFFRVGLLNCIMWNPIIHLPNGIISFGSAVLCKSVIVDSDSLLIIVCSSTDSRPTVSVSLLARTEHNIQK